MLLNVFEECDCFFLSGIRVGDHFKWRSCLESVAGSKSGLGLKETPTLLEKVLISASLSKCRRLAEIDRSDALFTTPGR